MPFELRLRKKLQQPPDERYQLFRLFRRPRVGGMPVLVQSAFVTDADGAPVEGTAMGAHFEQPAVLADGSVAADVEVVADGAEPTGTMVVQELLHGIVAVAAGGGTVEDDVAHRVGGVHHQSAFHFGEELALVEHLLPADSHGKCFLYHNICSIKGEQLVTPSAVSAAMAAWMMILIRLAQLILFFVIDFMVVDS